MKRKQRTYKREVFAGQLRAGRLTTRGCRTTVVDAEGNYLRDAFDPRKACWLNLGDRVIVSNANLDVDEVASATVVAMRQDGSAIVDARGVSDGAVHVMKCGGKR